MDIDLGKGIDGTQAAETIQKDFDIPIVFLSSHMEPEIVEKTEKITSYGYVVKNSSITVLDASIKMAFKLFYANKRHVESEGKFSQIFHLSPYPVMLIDTENGNFVDINDAAIKEIGFAREELIGKNGVDAGMLDPKIIDITRKIIVEKGRYENLEIEVRNKAGEKRIGLASGNIIHSSGKRFLVQTIVDITERKKTEKEMLSNMGRLKISLNMLNIAVFNQDLHLRYTWMYQPQLGYEESAVIGKNDADLLPSQDASAVISIKEKVLKTASRIQEEVTINSQDGPLWYSLVCEPTFDEFGVVDGLVGSTLDITERKEAEKTFKDTSRHLNSLYENISDALYFISYDGEDRFRFMSVNPAFLKATGLKESKIAGKLVSEVLPEPSLHLVLSRYHEAIETRHAVQWEETTQYPTGAKTADVTISPIFGDDGICTSLIGTVYDITERRKIQQKMIKSIDDLNETQKIAHVGSWSLDIATNEIAWSDELYRMYGYDPEDPPPLFPNSNLLFTEDCWEMLSSAIAKTGKDGIPYELELETMKKDGSHGWMWAFGNAVTDEGGTIVGLRGAVQDITERKKTEQELYIALKKSEENELRFEIGRAHV